MIKVVLHGESDIGRVRRVNEDSFRLIPERGTMVVCDGMGGHAAGEIASQRAVETVEASLLRSREMAPPPVDLVQQVSSALPQEAVEMVWAVRLANRRVYQTARAQKQMRGMGTTLVAARFAADAVIICHVGDSRAYRFRSGALTPLTTDHSLVAELVAQNEITPEQARNFPDRNIITRALGTRPGVAVDIDLFAAVAGDWYLLCSDGLSGSISDEEMEMILRENAKTPGQAIEALIAAANAAGGQDNITVAIAEIQAAGGDGQDPLGTETVPESSEETADAELSSLATLFPDSSAMDHPPEIDTDKIMINPALWQGEG